MIPTQKKENKQQSEIAILTMVYVVMLTASVFLLPAVFIAAYAKKQAGIRQTPAVVSHYRFIASVCELFLAGVIACVIVSLFGVKAGVYGLSALTIWFLWQSTKGALNAISSNVMKDFYHAPSK